jgi:class 3 adenylate cyclase
MLPETHYARSGDTWIAYQVTGDGPVDLLIGMTMQYPIDSHFEDPDIAAFFDRLGSFGRVIRLDRRGGGMSDPVTPDAPPTLDQWVSDCVAVLDTVGSERAAFLGTDVAGSMVGMLMAATRPDRISSLVLHHPTPSPMRRAGWEWGFDEAEIPARLDRIEQGVVTGDMLPTWRPLDSAHQAWSLRAVRRGSSPSIRRMTFEIFFASDLRDVLPTIRVPTLVMANTDPDAATTPFFATGSMRHVADAIPGARLLEFSGPHQGIFSGVPEAILAEIEEFITGVRPAPRPDDRVFATVLFTDIVSSTARAVDVGDRRWREMLDRHDGAVRTQIDRFRGVLVKGTGDGLLATFDGPARAVRCAQAITDALRSHGIEVRAGLHAGEVEHRGEDIAGIAVHIGARVQALAGAGEVLVSSTVKDLVAGSGIEFADRGTHTLKGVPDEWRIFAVQD